MQILLAPPGPGQIDGGPPEGPQTRPLHPWQLFRSDSHQWQAATGGGGPRHTVAGPRRRRTGRCRFYWRRQGPARAMRGPQRGHKRNRNVHGACSARTTTNGRPQRLAAPRGILWRGPGDGVQVGADFTGAARAQPDRWGAPSGATNATATFLATVPPGQPVTDAGRGWLLQDLWLGMPACAVWGPARYAFFFVWLVSGALWPCFLPRTSIRQASGPHLHGFLGCRAGTFWHPWPETPGAVWVSVGVWDAYSGSRHRACLCLARIRLI